MNFHASVLVTTGQDYIRLFNLNSIIFFTKVEGPQPLDKEL